MEKSGPKRTSFTSPKNNPNFPQVLDVTCQEVLEKKESVHLIDVRRNEEYIGEYGHIPGAALMTLDRLSSTIGQLPKDETIVFVCRSGGRSAQAAAFAQSLGFQSVFNMAGGMIAWTESQFPAEDKNPHA